MSDSARILIVEPDDQVVADYVSSLSHFPWHIDRAHTIREALSLTAQSVYDLAIIDMVLPDGVGTDAWDYLKRIHPGLRAILTTLSPVLHTSINPAGPDVLIYALKPLNPELLARCIAEAIGPPRAGAEPPPTRRAFAEPVIAPPAVQPAPLRETRVRRQLQVPVLLTALVLGFILLISGVGVAAAAQAALPADSLYPVKTSIESFQLALTPDTSNRVQLLLALGQVRLDEVNALAAKGRYGEISPTVRRYEEEVTSAAELVRIVLQKDRTGGMALASMVARALARSSTILQLVLEKVPEETKPAIAHALALSETGQSNLEQEPATSTPAPPATVTPTLASSSTPSPEATPGPNQVAEPSQTPGPPGQAQTPPGQAQTPPGQNQIPPGQNQTPPGQNQTPPGQNQIPPGQNKTPPGQNQTPPGQNKTPPGQSKTPPGPNKTPGPGKTPGH